MQNATSQTFENPNTAPFRPSFHPTDFAAHWSAGTGWSGQSNPTLLAFGGNLNSIPAQQPGASGSSDYGGVREAHMYVETINGVETWFLFYGAGDGTTNSTGQWRPQLATSTNRGRSWTKQGPLNIQLQSGDGTAPNSRDMLYMEKRGSNYYLYAMKGLGTSASTSRGLVPAPPFVADEWVLADTGVGPVGTWTYVGDATLQGSSGSIDDLSSYMNSVVQSGGEYFMFLSITKNNPGGNPLTELLNVSYATASSPAGPWTKSNVTLFAAAINSDTPENPKVFYHPVLGTYCMSLNECIYGDPTDRNTLYTTSNITSWSYTARRVYMHVSALDGQSAIGLMTPFYSSEGIVSMTEDGYVPFVYDTNPLASSGIDVHVGREILYGVLEPSPSCLNYASTGGTPTPVFSDNFSGGTAGTPINGHNGWVTLDTNGGTPVYVAGTGFSDAFTGTAGAAIGGNNGWVTLDTTGGTPVYLSGGGADMGSNVGESLIYNTGTSCLNPTISAGLTLGTGCAIGLSFRYQAATRFYNLDCQLSTDGTTLLGTLYCNENQMQPASGLGTSLGAYVAGQTVTVTVSGNTFTVQYGSNAAVTFTDAANTISTAGYCGMRNGGGYPGTRHAYNFNATLTSGGVSLGTAVGESLIYNTGTSELNPIATAELTLAAGCSIGFVSRYQSSTIFYNLDCAVSTDGTQLLGVLYANGARISPATGQGTLLGTYIAGQQVTVTVSGSNFTVQYGSNASVAFNDAGNTITTAGYCGLRNGSGTVGTRTAQAYAVSLATPGPAASTYYTEANGDAIAEFSVDIIASGAGYIAYDFRTQSNGDTYRLKCVPGAGLTLYKVVSGTATQIGTPTGTQVTAQGYPCRIKVKAVGSAIQAWLNGEQQISVTDSTFASGVKLGFNASSDQYAIRNLVLYPSDTVTISGLVSGQVVTLRAPGGPPIESKTASGSTVTFTEFHYPAGSVDIDGVDNVVQGGIWGGDTHAFAPGQRYSFA